MCGNFPVILCTLFAYGIYSHKNYLVDIKLIVIHCIDQGLITSELHNAVHACNYILHTIILFVVNAHTVKPLNKGHFGDNPL